MCLTSMWYECEWLKGKTCKCFSRSYSFCCFLVSTIKIRQILPINCKEINEFLFSTKNKKKTTTIYFIELTSFDGLQAKKTQMDWTKTERSILVSPSAVLIQFTSSVVLCCCCCWCGVSWKLNFSICASFSRSLIQYVFQAHTVSKKLTRL